MTKKDKEVLINVLRKLSSDITAVADVLGGGSSLAQKPESPAEEKAPAAAEAGQESEKKTCTYEEARAVLAEKARTGYRAEVKAILTSHGLKQLSDARDPEVYAAIVAETEAIGNA
jgi:argininosuccinate lyase